ncbi:MAG: oligosaccharide flippase family protein [Acidobacteriia bacterium]|nr:oligosaccharide flippase family protein [Terriglobia bacterium]
MPGAERREDIALLARGATLLVNNGLGQGLGFLASIAISRLLGVRGFGEYATVMAMIFVATVAAEAGIEASLTREIARDPARSRSLLAASVRAKAAVGGGLAVLLALGPVAAFLAPGSGSVGAVRLAGILLTLNTVNSSFSAVFRAWGRMDVVLGINLAGQVAQLAGVVAVLLATPSVTAVVAWFTVVQLAELAAGWVLFRRGEPPRAPGARIATGGRDTAAALVRRSLPFALAGILGTLELRVDLFLVQAVCGAVVVAAYSVAMRLHEVLGLVPNSLFAALFPALSAAHGETGSAQGERLYGRALRFVLALGGVAAVGGLLFADFLVRVTFGPTYAPAVTPLRILAVMLVPLLANRTTTLHLYASGRERRANAFEVVNLALRAGLGWMFVTRWGAAGAAWANLAAETIVLATYALTGAMRVSAPADASRCADARKAVG